MITVNECYFWVEGRAARVGRGESGKLFWFCGFLSLSHVDFGLEVCVCMCCASDYIETCAGISIALELVDHIQFFLATE